MKEIELTQYMMPNGRRTQVKTDVEDEIADMVVGMRLSCEMLMTQEIALYAIYPGEKEEKEMIRVCKNGPEVQIVLGNLIRDKYKEHNGGKP